MQKLVKKLHRPIKRRWLFVAIAIVLVMLIGAWAYDQHRARPLDNNFDYLGKSDYGCWLLPMCAEPGSVYYYGTNISPTTIKDYFQGVTYDTKASDNTIAAFSTSPAKGFTVMYESKNTDLYHTDKKYIVTLSNSAYDEAVKHLP
jgi:hypothetical protein